MIIDLGFIIDNVFELYNLCRRVPRRCLRTRSWVAKQTTEPGTACNTTMGMCGR